MKSIKISVKVIPGSSENKVIVGDEGNIQVRLTALADQGKANKALIKLLAKHFKTAQSSITITRGGKSKQKIVLIQK
ncbi:MAG: DUF167 domain-containing protein [bacterium]